MESSNLYHHHRGEVPFLKYQVNTPIAGVCPPEPADLSTPQACLDLLYFISLDHNTWKCPLLPLHMLVSLYVTLQFRGCITPFITE